MLGRFRCGCDTRRDILFTQGHPDLAVAVTLGVAIAAIAIAWKYRPTPT